MNKSIKTNILQFLATIDNNLDALLYLKNQCDNKINKFESAQLANFVKEKYSKKKECVEHAN